MSEYGSDSCTGNEVTHDHRGRRPKLRGMGRMTCGDGQEYVEEGLHADDKYEEPRSRAPAFGRDEAQRDRHRPQENERCGVHAAPAPTGGMAYHREENDSRAEQHSTANSGEARVLTRGCVHDATIVDLRSAVKRRYRTLTDPSPELNNRGCHQES